MNNIGDIGEKTALAYLSKFGYRFIVKNYRKKFGEIDLILISPYGTLIIVEVKTMFAAKQLLKPEDNLTSAKLRKLRKIGEFFVNSHPELIDDEKGWQIDLIAVILYREESGKLRARIRHYKGIG